MTERIPCKRMLSPELKRASAPASSVRTYAKLSPTSGSVVVTVPTTLPLVAAGRYPLARLITHRRPLSEGPQAYRLFDRREDGCIKMVLEPGRPSPR